MESRAHRFDKNDYEPAAGEAVTDLDLRFDLSPELLQSAVVGFQTLRP